MEGSGKSHSIWLPEFLKTIWKYRYVILAVTAASVGLAFLYCIIATPLYRVTCQVRPGITAFDNDGNAKHSWNPKDIKAYFSSMANWKAVTNPDERKKLPADISMDSSGSIVKIDLYCKDPQFGKELINRIVGRLNSQNSNANLQMTLSRKVVKQRLDQALQQKKQLNINQKKLNRNIAKIQNKISLIKAEIETTNQKIALSKESLKECENIIGNVRKNTQDLLEYRKRGIKNSNLNEIQMLLLLNTIQQNIAYLNTLETRLVQLKKDIARFKFDIQAKESRIDALKIDIENLLTQRDKEFPLKLAMLEKRIETLKTRIKSFNVLEVVSMPMASSKPVRPNVIKTTVLAGLLGFMASIFFIYIKKVGFVENNMQEMQQDNEDAHDSGASESFTLTGNSKSSS